jgi:dTMP kinase
MNGRLITFEGVEGSGKTTQIKRLSDYLEGGGFKVEVYREPGATRVGEQIRKILLNPDHIELCPYTELLLYYAARAQIVDEKIAPAVNSGVIALCDRYYDSSTAYQHYGRGLEIKLLDVLTDNFVKVHPNLTILLDIPVKEGLIRRGKSLDEFGKLDRLEAEAYEFHERVRQGYLEIAWKNPERVKIVDGSLSPDTIFACIASHVNELLQK